MPRLELSLLGGFHASVDGSPLTGFDTDKTRALLVYICVEASRPHWREALAGLLWPELPEDAARRNLRNSLFKLRQALGQGEEGGSSDLLLITSQTVQLSPDAGFWLDVTEFSGLLAECWAHRHRKLEYCTTCHGRLQRAAALYRGPFLGGFYLVDCQEFEEWLVLKREALHREALDALGRLAAYHEAHGEYEQALYYAYRQLEVEPWREETHRQVMELLALSGRRSAALAQYEVCRKVLAEKLDAEPSAETTALFNLLEAGGAIGDDGRWTTDDGALSSSILREFRTHRPSSIVHNLPQQLSPFIGRKDELARILERLDSPDYRLTTLLGPGGVGKTRLALQAASEQVGAFEDGVYWVPLASVTAGELLTSTIAQVIGFHFEATEDPETQLINYLQDKEMLLVLDNFEHLLGGGGATNLLLSILTRASRVSLLVTSRERLGLQAEFLLDLSGLPVPRMDDGPRSASSIVHRPSSNALASYGAVQLFVERAQQAHSGFALSDDNAGGVVDICSLVDGLPLGIVLAAAWVRHFPPDRIASSIRTNLDFLTSAGRDASPEHASLRAVFNHSWGLLSDDERRVFRSLSVFRGGWEEEAAERVAEASLLSLLSLVDKSLLRQSTTGRYDIHEVLRQYAAEKLDESPEEREAANRRHAEYFAELAEQADRELRGEDQDKWLERLEREHDNLRAVLGWAVKSNQAEVGLRLGGALARFWFIRGHFSEGRGVLAELLSLPPRGELSEDERLRLKTFRAKALQAAGDVSRAQGDYTTSRPLYEESLALYRELGNKKDITVALLRLAINAFNQSDNPLGNSLTEESLVIARERGDKQDIVIALNLLGLLSFTDGDYVTARSVLEEGMVIHRELGNRFNLAITLNNLGNVALMQGDCVLARSRHLEALALRRELGDKWGVAICLVGLGGVAVLEGDPERGTRVLAAADALLTATGASLEADDRIPYEYAVASARARLDEEAFAREWAAGQALPTEQAIAQALEEN